MKRDGVTKSAARRTRRLLVDQRKATKNERARPANYRAYIDSAQWRDRCKRFYAVHGRHCAACDATTGLQVHHMAYTHLGRELDSELAVLCGDCHLDFHETHGTSHDMIAKTTAFIVDKRQLAELTALA